MVSADKARMERKGKDGGVLVREWSAPFSDSDWNLLTVLCATRFPKAILLLTSQPNLLLKPLTRFFSTFGLPRIIQTDQGTNFKSALFQRVVATSNVQHAVSSPYHPQSRGMLRCAGIRRLSRCSENIA